MCWSNRETRGESDGHERGEGGREGAKVIGCSAVEGGVAARRSLTRRRSRVPRDLVTDSHRRRRRIGSRSLKVVEQEAISSRYLEVTSTRRNTTPGRAASGLLLADGSSAHARYILGVLSVSWALFLVHTSWSLDLPPWASVQPKTSKSQRKTRSRARTPKHRHRQALLHQYSLSIPRSRGVRKRWAKPARRVRSSARGAARAQNLAPRERSASRDCPKGNAPCS
jgi:hypothetical protein